MERRLERAFTRVAEDESLTADLRDPEARILLDWAQGEVLWLVVDTVELDDEAAWAVLGPKLQHLRRWLRQIAALSAASECPAEMLRSLLRSPVYPENKEALDG